MPPSSILVTNLAISGNDEYVAKIIIQKSLFIHHRLWSIVWWPDCSYLNENHRNDRFLISFTLSSENGQDCKSWISSWLIAVQVLQCRKQSVSIGLIPVNIIGMIKISARTKSCYFHPRNDWKWLSKSKNLFHGWINFLNNNSFFWQILEYNQTQCKYSSVSNLQQCWWQPIPVTSTLLLEAQLNWLVFLRAVNQKCDIGYMQAQVGWYLLQLFYRWLHGQNMTHKMEHA